MITPVATAKMGVPVGAAKSSPVWLLTQWPPAWPKRAVRWYPRVGRCQEFFGIWPALASAARPSDFSSALDWAPCSSEAGVSLLDAESCRAWRSESRLTAMLRRESTYPIASVPSGDDGAWAAREIPPWASCADGVTAPAPVTVSTRAPRIIGRPTATRRRVERAR